MSEYTIQDKGLQRDTETTSAVATISYEIENAKYNGLKDSQIKAQLKKLQNKDKFPSNLEYMERSSISIILRPIPTVRRQREENGRIVSEH